MGYKRERTRTSDDPENEGEPSTSSFPEVMPCSSRVELSQKSKPLRLADSNQSKLLSSQKDMTDQSGKQCTALFSSPPHHHQHRQNFGLPIYLKYSRHNHGHHYHCRNPGTYLRASSSRGKGSSWDGRLSIKISSHDYGQYTGVSEINVPKIIIQSNSTDTSLHSPDPEKIPCGICHSLLKRRPLHASSAGESAVVAVLVCGHLYHADCLEQKTAPEEKSDPHCPICLSLSVCADEAVNKLD